MTPERQQYYDNEFNKLNQEKRDARGEDYDQLQMDVYNGNLEADAAYSSFYSYEERANDTLGKMDELDELYHDGKITEDEYECESKKLEDRRNSYEAKADEALKKYNDIKYSGDPSLADKESDLMDRNSKINAVDEKIDELGKQYNEEEAIEGAQQEGEKNETNNTDKTEQTTDESTSDAKSETNETSQEPGQPESTNPENETEGPSTTDDIEAYQANVLPERDNVVVDNFKIPNWDYLGYVQEMQQFKKGLTSITGEPGWFYFKIIFHFDDTFGLLGNIVYNSFNESHRGNTAIQYLTSRAGRFKKDNLKSRAIALEKFVKYLSFINSSCPWFFDKITGLNEVVPQLNEFSKEKKIEISCMPDAIDMRLTSLLYLYQYACYDDIFMKEIIPENLRKFNMSVIIYHMPIKFHSTTIDNGGSIKAKSIYDTGNFSYFLSYKLYTFKGCEIDLASLGNVVPNSLDNQQPFNLGQNTITIKYDRAFTHIMNEWEQFMVGSDGYYYNQEKQIGIANESNKFKERIDRLIQANDGGSRQLLDGLLTKGATTFADRGQLIGNIYNLDIDAYKQNILMERTQPIYLANLFDIDIYYYKLLALARHTDPSKRLTRGVKGEGIRRFPNSNTLAQMFNTGTTYRLFSLSNSVMSNNYISQYDLLIHNYNNSNRIYASTWYMQPYQTSIADIITQYKNAWKDIKGIFKSNVNAIKNIGKDIARSWGF